MSVSSVSWTDILHDEAGIQLGGAEVDQRLDVIPVPEDEELLEPGVLGTDLRDVDVLHELADRCLQLWRW